MEALVRQGVLVEWRDAQRLYYALQAPEMVFSAGYDMLQTQLGGLLPCTWVLHDGKDTFAYDIARYSALGHLLPSLQPESFLAIVQKIFSILVYVRSIGPVQMGNIEPALDKIFMDSSSGNIYLVYLPIALPHTAETDAGFEAHLKANLFAAIHQHTNLQSQATWPLYNVLYDPAFSVAQIWEMLAPDPVPAPPPDAQATHIAPAVPARQGDATRTLGNIFVASILFVGLQTPEPIQFLVSKPDYIIGKKTGACDGLIAFNNAISRVHCKIRCVDGQNYLVDLGSANGTFLNGVRLVANKPAPIKPGDKVKLANNIFLIQSI